MPINPSPAVKRAGDVLWYLAEHPSEAHSVSQLARILNIPRATCDSIVQALAQQGFLARRDGEGGYDLGASCLALASAAQAANTVLNMANRQAEELARDLQGCVAVSTVIAGQLRVVAVFDRASATVARVTIGHVVPLTPPFGAVFAAWDPAAAERWIRAAGDTGERIEGDRWRQALDFARRHGYSYSVLAPPAERFGQVMEALAVIPDSEPSRRDRDDLMDQMRRSEYLATRIEPGTEVQLLQVSAPVFDSHGAVVSSIMVLGSIRPMLGEEVDVLGGRVVQAAGRATTLARGLRLGEPAPAV